MHLSDRFMSKPINSRMLFQNYLTNFLICFFFFFFKTCRNHTFCTQFCTKKGSGAIKRGIFPHSNKFSSLFYRTWTFTSKWSCKPFYCVSISSAWTQNNGRVHWREKKIFRQIGSGTKGVKHHWHATIQKMNK